MHDTLLQKYFFCNPFTNTKLKGNVYLSLIHIQMCIRDRCKSVVVKVRAGCRSCVCYSVWLCICKGFSGSSAMLEKRRCCQLLSVRCYSVRVECMFRHCCQLGVIVYWFRIYLPCRADIVDVVYKHGYSHHHNF